MAMTRITWRGKRLNTRTRDMILGAEKILGFPLTIVQGSYNAGGVSASAGTHDGGGAADFSTRGMSNTRKLNVVSALRKVGFAAWLRYPSQGDWSEHIHAIAKGDLDLSRGARNQVTAYMNGRNGLASNGRDTFTRAYVNNTWEKYKASLVPAKPAVPPLVFHTLSVKAGAKGLALSPWTKTEVEKFLSYCVQTGALSRDNRNSWLNVVEHKNWAHAGLIVTQAIKNVQNKGGLTVDGIFGPVTAAYVTKSPIANVIVNG